MRSRERLPPIKVPRRIFALPALPKNEMGKVVKARLKALVVERSGGAGH